MPLAEHHEIFAFEKDQQGRDIAIPLMTRREIRMETWNLVCQAFDYSRPLVEKASLSEYQRKLHTSLAGGQNNAILCGPPGTGKTSVAMLALRDLHLAGYNVKATRFSQFKIQMEPRFCDENDISPETVARWYSSPDVLLLDELGYGDTRQTAGEHERRIFFDLLSVRDSTGRRTWICSNTSRIELHRIYGEAAISRLDGAGICTVGDFTNQPNRRY